jgi:hypothetical protein
MFSDLRIPTYRVRVSTDSQIVGVSIVITIIIIMSCIYIFHNMHYSSNLFSSQRNVSIIMTFVLIEIYYACTYSIELLNIEAPLIQNNKIRVYNYIGGQISRNFDTARDIK